MRPADDGDLRGPNSRRDHFCGVGNALATSRLEGRDEFRRRPAGGRGPRPKRPGTAPAPPRSRRRRPPRPACRSGPAGYSASAPRSPWSLRGGLNRPDANVAPPGIWPAGIRRPPGHRRPDRPDPLRAKSATARRGAAVVRAEDRVARRREERERAVVPARRGYVPLCLHRIEGERRQHSNAARISPNGLRLAEILDAGRDLRAICRPRKIHAAPPRRCRDPPSCAASRASPA